MGLGVFGVVLNARLLVALASVGLFELGSVDFGRFSRGFCWKLLVLSKLCFVGIIKDFWGASVMFFLFLIFSAFTFNFSEFRFALTSAFRFALLSNFSCNSCWINLCCSKLLCLSDLFLSLFLMYSSCFNLCCSDLDCSASKRCLCSSLFLFLSSKSCEKIGCWWWIFLFPEMLVGVIGSCWLIGIGIGRWRRACWLVGAVVKGKVPIYSEAGLRNWLVPIPTDGTNRGTNSEGSKFRISPDSVAFRVYFNRREHWR